MISQSLNVFLGFSLFVGLMMLFDFGVLQRRFVHINMRAAMIMSAFWVTLGLSVMAAVYFLFGTQSAFEYLTGYILELSLSVDNLFVFLVIFSYFRVDDHTQRRVLMWGIIGAFLMRFILIYLGTALIEQFNWLIYIFGAFLVYTGFKLARQSDNEEPSVEKNPAVRFARRFLPMTDEYHGDRFSVIKNGKRLFTPLMIVLLVIETTDLLFAVDSIPAAIAVTQNPFIIIASNMMAILGLRALYFLLAGVMDKFHYLKYALAIILVFIGLKMLTEDWLLEGILHIHKEQLAAGTLIFVVLMLAGSIVLSFLRKPKHSD
jgi:tellurite resistance protein TerC